MSTFHHHPSSAFEVLIVRHAACDCPRKLVRLLRQKCSVFVVIDERHLDEYGGHISILEHEQLRHVLHAAVYRAETVDNLRLDALRKLLSLFVAKEKNNDRVCQIAQYGKKAEKL